MGSEYGAEVFNFGHAGVATCTDMIGVTYTEVGNFGHAGGLLVPI